MTLEKVYKRVFKLANAQNVCVHKKKCRLGGRQCKVALRILYEHVAIINFKHIQSCNITMHAWAYNTKVCNVYMSNFFLCTQPHLMQV